MAVTINVPSQVKTYANLAAFPASGSLKTIYIAEDTNKTYRWTGSVYVEISATAASTWGAIGGTLSNQTDLQNALNAKQNTLVSGTNIKTINSTSLLGSGNVSVQDTLVSGTNIKTINSTSLLGTGNVSVQDTLVSGTNIKTIEGQSLLGSGNIDLSKSDIGLGNVDNTSDADKPVSTATQTALNAKQNTLVSGTSIKTIEGQSLLGSGNIDLSKSDVGLSNVDNTSDANKPISTATQTALNAKQATIFNAKAFGTQSAAVGETQMAQITIPANTFASTDKLAFFAFFNKVGNAHSSTIRFKISTSASMPTGATGLVAIYTAANTSLFTKVNREFIISGGTLRGFPFASSSNNDVTISTSAMGSVAFDPTVTQYFYVSVAPSASTTDVTYLEGCEIKEL